MYKNSTYWSYMVYLCQSCGSGLTGSGFSISSEYGSGSRVLIMNFFLCLCVIFAILDPDPDTYLGTRLNADLIRIRIRNIELCPTNSLNKMLRQCCPMCLILSGTGFLLQKRAIKEEIITSTFLANYFTARNNRIIIFID
jgi:hypothetical protein